MKKINKFVYWTPRVLSIIFVIFLGLMSLDVISEDLSFWQIVLGLFMHNIPALILLVVIIFSWKYELIGGIVFILAGIIYIILLLMNSKFEWYMLVWAIQISGISFFIGILFLINWYKKRNRKDFKA